MNTAVSEACAFGAELSLYDTMAPSSASAVEQSAVDVSMSMILSILLQCKHVFQVREYFECGLLQRRVEHGFIEHLVLDEMECVVQRTECHDEKTCDYRGLEKCENQSEQLVQPSEHHEFEHAFQHLSKGSKYKEYGHKNQGECHHLQDLLRSRDVACHPFRYYVGETG